MSLNEEENENEDVSIERRVMQAYLDDKISKQLYYELEGIEDILKALMNGNITKKLYFEFLGCQEVDV